MHVSRWVWLALPACLWHGKAEAQILHPLSEAREVYAKARVTCADSVELRQVPSAPFALFDGAVGRWIDGSVCQSDASVQADQRSLILADSIYVHEHTETEMFGPGAQIANSRSDASITFRVEPGERTRILLDGDLIAQQGGSGVAVVTFSLVQIGGGVLDTLRVQSGPGRATYRENVLVRYRILSPGDYALEAHSSSQAGTTSIKLVYAEFWLHVTFFNVTTVAPSTWGRVKALYCR